MYFDIEEVKSYIKNCSVDSRIYIGCDSERFKKNGIWHADYATVVVIHIDGKRGCKIFGEITRERDYDNKPSRPSIRLMNEVTKVASLYFKLEDSIGKRP